MILIPGVSVISDLQQRCKSVCVVYFHKPRINEPVILQNADLEVRQTPELPMKALILPQSVLFTTSCMSRYAGCCPSQLFFQSGLTTHSPQ